MGEAAISLETPRKSASTLAPESISNFRMHCPPPELPKISMPLRGVPERGDCSNDYNLSSNSTPRTPGDCSSSDSDDDCKLEDLDDVSTPSNTPRSPIRRSSEIESM